jgi:hypothetical protein
MIRHITASRLIGAASPVIHGIIADYRDGHRRIVSPKAFLWLAVDKGGTGAGTEIRFAMRAFGKVRTTRGVVTEPEPGRVLVETYPDTGDVTTFVIDPRPGANETRVTIKTDLHVRDGLAGRLEGFLAERFLLPHYDEELERLAHIAEGLRQYDPVPSGPAD